jgi:membrane-associated protease RseP (regulator of RpoE activity)
LAPTDTVLAINNIDVSSSDDIKRALSDFQPGDTISLRFIHEGREVERSLVLAASDNSTDPIIGFQGLDSTMISGILENYRRPSITSPLIYFFIPTFAQAQWAVPFSDSMHNFYTSPLGDATFFVANILFWLWFVNFNLAIFNALPLYPLDGGQALRAGLQTYGENRGWNEKTAKRVVTAISLFIVALLISVIVGPYIIPYIQSWIA